MNDLDKYLKKLMKMRHESINKRRRKKRWDSQIDNPHKVDKCLEPKVKRQSLQSGNSKKSVKSS